MTISLSVPLNWKFVSPLILISLAALFTVTTNPLSMTVFQLANAITLNVATTAFINVTPSPIQIGQMVHIDMWVEPLPPTPADVFFTLIITVAKPDGTTEFLGPFLSYPNGSAHTSYMPMQIGTYMLHLNYSGQYFANNTIYYLPSVSPVTTLNVMQELVQVTWIVDDDGLADFSSIQEAVDAASTGDVICVRNGHYNEHVVINKSLSLFGENASQTVIDGNNEIMENARNVVTINAYNVVVSGFTIQRSAGFPYEGAGVYLSGLGAFANVSGNKVTSNYYGFYLNSSSYNNISLNEVIDNYCGFCLRSSSNNVFSANNITNNDQDDYQVGFSVTEFSSNNVISGNNIANNDAGVGVSNSDGTTISANNITNGENGITLHFGSRSIVHANNIIDTRNYGIQLDFSHNCNVSQNTVTSNSWYAVFIYYSSENTIFANDITDNSNCGLRLNSSSNNTLYHNNIVNNTIQVSSVDSVNIWDYGYPSGGNYWSDYNGTDANHDGIGDTPHVIDASNQDNYPLMNPYTQTRTWTVDDDGPADFNTIQGAINAARLGDTIIVYSGTYVENVVVNKRLTLKSQMGAGNTIVRPADPMTQIDVFEVTADNVTISGFTVTAMIGWGAKGIHLNAVEYCTISDNNCYDNGAGIFLSNSDNNIIMNNNASNNQDGIYLHQSHNNKIINNTVLNNTYGRGIMLVFSSNNQILNNTSNFNQDGIILMERPTANNVIANNTVRSNQNYGIHFFAADNNTILNNTLLENGVGIWLRGASVNNEIASNIVFNNSYGIYLGDPSNNLGQCLNNVIYHNDFVYNAMSVYSYDSTNTWDDGYPSGGNYWSDYNGTDNNGDGIGDSPYVIDVNNTDRYPLMTPYVSSVYPPQPSPSPSPSPTTTPTPSPSPSPSSTPVIPETNPVATLVALVVVTCIVAAAIRKKAFRHISNKALTFCLTSRMSGRLCHKR